MKVERKIPLKNNNNKEKCNEKFKNNRALVPLM